MILMIDNYDSFTYNLVQYFGELGGDLLVKYNDQITLADIRALAPEKIVLSPGPGRPEAAGICLKIIETFGDNTPILGVCLGHQAIAMSCGAKIKLAPRLMHGKTSAIYHQQQGVFHQLPSPFQATRYHSLLVDEAGFPEELMITAWSEYQQQKEIMGLQHRYKPLYGVQFHPESILSEQGKKLLQTFKQ